MIMDTSHIISSDILLLVELQNTHCVIIKFENFEMKSPNSIFLNGDNEAVNFYQIHPYA